MYIALQIAQTYKYVPPFHSPSPEHMVHISSLAASSSVTDVIFITTPPPSFIILCNTTVSILPSGGSLWMWMWQIDLFTETSFYRINEFCSKGLVLMLLWPWDFLYSELEEMLRERGRGGRGGRGRGPFVGIKAPGKACGGSCLAGHLGHTSGHLWASKVHLALICTETKIMMKNVNKIGIRWHCDGQGACWGC